jgi:hypothetical protein
MLAASLQLLRRRWITAVIGVLTTAATLGLVLHAVQPTYQASSQVMLLLPPEPPEPDQPPVNPYLNLSAGMGTTAALLAGMVTTKDVTRQLGELGLDAEYTVVLVAGAGPVLEITSTGSSPRVALGTRDAVMDLVDADLARIQAEADVPPSTIMTTTRPTVSTEAEPLHGRVLQAGVATAVGGMVLTMLLCLAGDRLVRLRARRLRRRAERQADQPEPVAADPGAEEPGEPASAEDETLEEEAEVAAPVAARSSVRHRDRSRRRAAISPVDSADPDGPDLPRTLAG